MTSESVCIFCLRFSSTVFIMSMQNTRETAHAIRKLPLMKAKRYLEDVLAHKQAIPFTRFCRGVGRTAQAKNRHSNGQGRWPAKSAKFILDLLKNAESNAEVCTAIFLVFSFHLPLSSLFPIEVNYLSYIFCRLKDWTWIHFTYLTYRSTKHRSRGVAHTVPMGELTVSSTNLEKKRESQLRSRLWFYKSKGIYLWTNNKYSQVF